MTDYTLNAAPAAYVYTGTAATLAYSVLPAGVGSFILTGIDAAMPTTMTEARGNVVGVMTQDEVRTRMTQEQVTVVLTQIEVGGKIT